MTDSYEHFDDDECNALLDSAPDNELASLESEIHEATIRARIWGKIRELDISVSIGENPEAYDQDFENLISSVADMVEALPHEDDETEERRNQRVVAIAQTIWDDEARILVQIARTLDSHLYSDLSDVERLAQKKILMAYIIASSEEQSDADEWLALIDATFEGEALDLTKSDDLEVLTHALDVTANLLSRPEVQLCQTILTLLGVPETDEEAPDEYDFEELEARSFAARDITEATLLYGGADQLPNRQAMIHDIIRRYDIDRLVIPNVLAITDAYWEKVETNG